MRVIWSIHDVSPGSAEWADRMVRRLTSQGATPLMILIVPAGDWAPEAISLLRRWETDGHRLALHGWDHCAVRPAGTYHRLHSLFLSRDAAEHLNRGGAEMLARIERGRAWFLEDGLSAPTIYVPPAWALGAVKEQELGAMGFRWVETLTGIQSTSSKKHRLLPLVGFEADNQWRRVALQVSNTINLVLARLSGRAVRVAIHPGDDAALLASDLDRWIRRGACAVLPRRSEG